MPLSLGLGLTIDNSQILGWSPANISQNILNLRADKEVYVDSAFTTPATTDSLVGGWKNWIGTANSATQTVSGSCPTLKATVFPSGLGGVYFTTDDVLLANVFGVACSGAATPYTMSMLLYPTLVTGAVRAFWAHGLTSSATLRDIHYLDSSLGRFAVDRRDGVVTAGGNSTTVAATGTQLITWVYNNNTLTVYRDGTQTHTMTITASGSMALNTTAIGARTLSGATSQYYEGYVGAIAAYNKALDATELAALTSYMKTLGGIT